MQSLSNAIRSEVASLFSSMDEPKKTMCRVQYLHGKIKVRQSQGRAGKRKSCERAGMKDTDTAQIERMLALALDMHELLETLHPDVKDAAEADDSD